ncbi:hypothetical protein [Halobacillus salinus]|uniref:Uncharacterized protein n=1 Tax=Halobacillus salinus TaxID=192814 RepID=A0A4Z0H0T9_9BACI|nr:hypothetical protein [Halobacillus salinus]TGB03589.1 hypothetical protein E4663_00865 [Halobacillus salinus]
MSDKICSKCEGNMVECYVADGLKGLLVKNPDGDKLFTNKKNTNINPNVCTDCGWVGTRMSRSS